MSDLYIGLMSGTSMDGIDAVLVRFDGDKPELLASHAHSWPVKVANRLHEEHARLLDAGTELKEMVEMILMDAVIPLDQFVARLEQFIEQQEAHMNYEEGVIFPHLRDSLTEDDWRHLEQLWQNRAINDPLFGAEVSQHFQALAKQLSLPAA